MSSHLPVLPVPPFEEMTAADALTTALRGIVAVRQSELLALREAAGRVLAVTQTAPRDVPEAPTSMMDGYALRALDGSGDHETATDSVRLRIAGQASAGHPFAGPVPRHSCIRILTGAIVPAGLDLVVAQERVESLPGGEVLIPCSELIPGRNVRPQGEDLVAGAPAVLAGRTLGSRELALLASMGIPQVPVIHTLRVAVVSTGDELVDPHDSPRAGQIYDSNRLMLLELVRQVGAQPIDLGIVADCPTALRQALQKAAQTADLVLTSGGVSIGDADYTRAVMAGLGTVSFWRLAIKPGRPLASGTLLRDDGEGIPFFGLPGNPVASFVTFLSIVRPCLVQLAGGEGTRPQPMLRARLSASARKQPGRTEYLRCQMRQGSQGDWLADVMPSQGAASIRSLMDADGLVVLPHEAGSLPEGTWVDVIDLRGL